MRTKNMKIKDVLTVVLLSLINIVIFGFGTFFYLTPITVLLMPIFYALFQGIVFYVIGEKVQKRGAIFLYCVIQGVIGFNLVYIAMFLIAGIIGELVVSKLGYANHKGLGISYVSMQLLASIGSTIYPYAFALEKTLENHDASGDYLANVEKAGHMIQSWGLLGLVVGILASAVIGAIIGHFVCKKHFKKDLAVEE